MSYDDIKSHKKPGFTLSLEDFTLSLEDFTLSFRKTTGGEGQIDPLPPNSPSRFRAN